MLPWVLLQPSTKPTACYSPHPGFFQEGCTCSWAGVFRVASSCGFLCSTCTIWRACPCRRWRCAECHAHAIQPDLKGPAEAALILCAAQEVLERLNLNQHTLCFIKPLCLRSSCTETWVMWLLAVKLAVPKRLRSQPLVLEGVLHMVWHWPVSQRHLPGFSSRLALLVQQRLRDSRTPACSARQMSSLTAAR